MHAMPQSAAVIARVSHMTWQLLEARRTQGHGGGSVAPPPPPKAAAALPLLAPQLHELSRAVFTSAFHTYALVLFRSCSVSFA